MKIGDRVVLTGPLMNPGSSVPMEDLEIGLEGTIVHLYDYEPASRPWRPRPIFAEHSRTAWGATSSCTGPGLRKISTRWMTSTTPVHTGITDAGQFYPPLPYRR